jgi:hypothetical protein
MELEREKGSATQNGSCIRSAKKSRSAFQGRNLLRVEMVSFYQRKGDPRQQTSKERSRTEL